jgi:hypothetical protein
VGAKKLAVALLDRMKDIVGDITPGIVCHLTSDF